ncbi:reverse transcriptase domain-containing protein, partial [Tanacetum coccineum]
MAPKKRTTRASPATTTTTTTTPITNAQLKALIDQGIADALAARKADKSMNGDDSYDSGTGVRRQAPLAPTALKFATCTLLGSTLTWWNSHIRNVGHDVAYAMTWTNLKKKITDKYCPRGKIKKLEVETWNLKVKGTDVVRYNQRFQELALMCARMFLEESDKIEKYVGGLPDMIQLNLKLNTWTRRLAPLMNVRLTTRESLMTLLRTIKTSSSLPKGRIWLGLIPQGLVRRNLTKDLNLCAPNA